ncbi:Hsp33 family molecular chaperone HslO [Xanthomonas fragariae]|uniref:Hsp33 family molecular chaperone HslO n=1 Tax=Xanthomonas fragariae TaxID=48664 RepID=UPI001ABE0B44|nr:Hsp33 family molecular chaperone HslO [Xanthomonas fragariae]UKR51825.1 Hsp33 family molecular chaperone HslO [Xanthomonas fragariae]
MTDYDQLSRFLLPAAGVRGVHVRLTHAWHDIQGAAEYPPAARRLLGEAIVAAALFTGHTKVGGRLSVQLRGNQTLRTLFAECTAAGTLRGIVQLADGADAPTDLRKLGEATLLAITIENPGLDPSEPQRYQSLVSMQAPDLAAAFETYFHQSEQLPTRLLLAAGPDQAAGLLLQQLPGDEGDNDGWSRIGALFDTLGAPELLSVAGEKLLYRLFHEEGPQLLGSKPLSFGCSCSRERVASMLQSLGEKEARAAAEATGDVEVRCEFCGREYHFPLTALEVLFGPARPSQEAPERLQ